MTNTLTHTPYRKEDLDAARKLLEKSLLLSGEARYALQLAIAEIDRCWKRIAELQEANSRGVELKKWGGGPMRNAQTTCQT